MIDLYKIVNGQQIKLSEEERKDHEQRELAWENDASKRDLEAVREKRAFAYPEIGNQLDAILKQLDALPADTHLPDLKRVLEEWKDVKLQYPKPTTKEV